MTYRTRIGILIGFIALFLIITPLVVLYTAGYRWNEKKFRLEKVGIIFLRSRPGSADIYLDGKLRTEKTPARLRDLIPDTYEVTIAKSGYASWTKNLTVESALTTFAEGIILWKNSAPEPLSMPPAQALTASEIAMFNRSKPLAATADNTLFKSDGFEIWTTAADGSNRDTITRLSNEINAIAPYTDAGWVIYETSTSIHAIERDGRGMRNDYTLATGTDLNGLAVSSDGKSLYYASGEGNSAQLWRRMLQ